MVTDEASAELNPEDLRLVAQVTNGDIVSVTPTTPVAPIDELLASAYVAELTELPLSELRNRRTQCAMVESSLSYERQLVQGRLDIVRDEQCRRFDRKSGD